MNAVAAVGNLRHAIRGCTDAISLHGCAGSLEAAYANTVHKITGYDIPGARRCAANQCSCYGNVRRRGTNVNPFSPIAQRLISLRRDTDIVSLNHVSGNSGVASQATKHSHPNTGFGVSGDNVSSTQDRATY